MRPLKSTQNSANRVCSHRFTFIFHDNGRTTAGGARESERVCGQRINKRARQLLATKSEMNVASRRDGFYSFRSFSRFPLARRASLPRFTRCRRSKLVAKPRNRAQMRLKYPRPSRTRGALRSLSLQPRPPPSVYGRHGSTHPQDYYTFLFSLSPLRALFSVAVRGFVQSKRNSRSGKSDREQKRLFYVLDVQTCRHRFLIYFSFF